MENNTLSNFKRCLKWAGIEPNGTLSIHTLRKSCAQVDKDHRVKAAVIDKLVSKGNAAESLTSETDAKTTPTAIHRSN